MDSPLVLSVAEVRQIDRIAVEKFGFPSVVLMENAGRGAVDALLEFDPELARGAQGVGILCGRGNNAGDGFVVARHLAIRGVPATIAVLDDPARLSGDAAANYRMAEALDLPRCDLCGVDPRDGQAIEQVLNAGLGGCTWLVDAMLGTGATGEPRQPFGAAVLWMNRQPARRLALDVPTGLNADTGEASAATVRADLTCTFAADKRGYCCPSAKEFLGALRVVSIGIPDSALRALGAQ